MGNAIFSERVVCVWLRFCGRCSLSGIMQTATMATWQETSTPGRAELLTGWLWYSLEEMNRTQRQQKPNDTRRVGRMGLPVSCTGAHWSLFTGGRAAGCNQKKGRENRKKNKDWHRPYSPWQAASTRLFSKIKHSGLFSPALASSGAYGPRVKNKDNAHILSYIMQNDPHLICKFPEILLNTFCSERIHLNLQLELSCIINEKRQFLAAY